MRPALIIAALLIAAPAIADDEEPVREPEFTCDQKNLPEELAALCAGLSDGYREAMSRPADLSGSGRPKLRERRKIVRHEIVGRGLDGAKIDRVRNPFGAPAERGLGVRITTDIAPVQFYSEMVQPGSDAATILNWEIKTELSPEQSGLFYGASTSGTYNTYNSGTSESISGFAGLRGIAKPADNVRIGAEIAPRAWLSDFSAPNASLSIDPKLTAASDLGRLGTSDFVGSINANAGYNLPLDGHSSAYGAIRFTVRPH